MEKARHSQTFTVVDLVEKQGMTLADAVIEAIGNIKDGSMPSTIEVADDAMRILEDRRQTRERVATSIARVDVIRSRRGSTLRKTTTYGQKGGDGPTRGHKAVIYTATAPDGTVLTKRSYFVDAQTAYIGAYEHQGVWHAAGVTDEKDTQGRPIYSHDGAPGQIALAATRKDPE